jgi:hypothetical protein
MNLKNVVIVVLILGVIFCGVTVWAGEKEELQWKARALVAEVNLAQQQLNLSIKAINDFKQELDSKGFMFQQDGTIVEKPKPPTNKKE